MTLGQIKKTDTQMPGDPFLERPPQPALLDIGQSAQNYKDNNGNKNLARQGVASGSGWPATPPSAWVCRVVVTVRGWLLPTCRHRERNAQAPVVTPAPMTGDTGPSGAEARLGTRGGRGEASLPTLKSFLRFRKENVGKFVTVIFGGCYSFD